MSDALSEPLVVAVVLNWNGAEWTIPCVASLHAQTYRNLRILVVDNGSRDDSVARLERECEGIGLLKLAQNRGFSGGCNAGIARALEQDADYVLVLNNDTELHHDCVGEMMKIAQSDQNIGAVTPKIFYSEPRDTLWWAGGYITRGFLRFPVRGIGLKDDGRWDTMRESPFVTGCCLLLSRHALQTAGAFDERFFAYYEDADLSLRLQRAGFACVYAPRAILWHKESASVRKNAMVRGESPFTIYFGTRNRMWTVRKHGTRGEIWLTCALLVSRAALRLPTMLAPRRRKVLRALWRGVRDGIREKL